MKKLLYSAAALALAFFAGSCQRENLEPVAGSGKVTYTVQVPGAIATRAHSDGFFLTYEVYRDGDLDNMDADPIYDGKEEFRGGKAELSLDFVKDQNFTVLFWAQKEDAYNVADLRAVSLKANANAEVFAGKDHVVSCASETDGMVSLVRPVGQINIATLTSGLTLGATTTVVPTHSMVTVSGLYTTYNVATKEVSGTHSVAFAKESVPKAAFDGYADYTPVATTYTGFMPTEGSTVDVDFKIYTENDGEITHSVPQVPVKANVRTYIIGNLVTATDDYTITLDETWPNEKNEVEVVWVSVSSAQGLQEAIEEAEEGKITNITLEGNVDLGTLAGLVSTKAAAPEYGVNIPYGKQLVLDLNGSTISQTVEQTSGYSMIQNDGELVIIDSKGNGRISYKDSGNGGAYISNTITNRGILTIKGGIIENTSSDATANVGFAYTIDTSIWGESSEVVVNIEGGTLKSPYSPLRLNGASSTKTIVANISGGELYGRIDHQMSTSTPAKAVLNISGGTFNAYGIKTDAIMVFGAGADTDASGIQLNVTGGTFKAPILVYRGDYVPLGQGFNEKFITDGTFAWDPSEFVAPGKAVVKEGDMWDVVDAEVSIEGVGYVTLAEALAAVQEGETITIRAGKTLEEGAIKLPSTLKNVTFAGEEGAVLKNMTISAADGNSYNYEGLTFNGITFDNSRILLTGWRTGDEIIKNLTVTNCVFKNLFDTTSEAALHINKELSEPVNGFTFTNNVIDGATGGSKSGIYAQLTGEVLVSGNIINNVAFRPFIIHITTDDNIVDNFVVTNNTFSGSAVGRAQGVGNNAEGTDEVNIVVTENIFKGITESQQICYWNFNSEKTVADLSHNYYDIDILANPGKIYYNTSAANVYDLIEMGVFPIYTDVNKSATFSPEVGVARIGDKEYATLQEAFNVGGEITLLLNTTVAETVVLPEGITAVLDLNGKTLAAADNNVVKNNGGNLTIKNGTVTRTGDVVGYSVNNASGEITVDNATIQCGLYTSGSKMIATNANISHEQSSRHAIYSWNCEVIINSGVFHNDNAGNATLMASGSSVVTINGGTFSIADGRSTLGWTSSMIDQNNTAQVLVKGGLFNGGFRINSADTQLTIEGGEFNTNNGSAFTDYSGIKVVKGGKFTDSGAQNWAKKYLAEGYILAGDEVKKGYVVDNASALVEAVNNAEAGAYIVVSSSIECNEAISLPVNSTIEIKEDAKINTLKATNGGKILIQNGKTLTLNNFSFGSKDTAGAEYEINGGTIVASYGFFQHGKYALRSNFETGYMYYSYGSDITVYGTFHSQGKGDGLDYVRGKLTIAKGGKSIHDKSLWVGQPASWGAMQANLTIEDGGYVQANSLSVYEGSSLEYYNDADLKYNSVTGTDYIIKK